MLSHIQRYPESRVCFGVSGFTLVLSCLWSGHVVHPYYITKKRISFVFLFLFVSTLCCQPSSSSSFSELINKPHCLGKTSFIHVKRILWSPRFTFIAYIFIKLPSKKILLLITRPTVQYFAPANCFLCPPLNTTKNELSQARKWGPVLGVPLPPLLPIC